MREQSRANGTHQMEERAGSERGFALILALLSLMLLTFLGLTLATSTSTELKIATNYRWQQQALYNAEAGIEAGKRILSGIQPDWQGILPSQRATGWDPTATPPANHAGVTPPTGNAETRNFESGPCDKRGNGVGYGVILKDTAGNSYQYTSSLYGQSLNGAFTLWVRRPTVVQNDGTIIDYGGVGNQNHVVLVSEGIAPYTGAALASNTAASNVAVQTIEVLLSQVTPNTQDNCQVRPGQTGGGAEGAGYAACSPISGGAAGLGDAVGAAGGARGGLGNQPGGVH